MKDESKCRSRLGRWMAVWWIAGAILTNAAANPLSESRLFGKLQGDWEGQGQTKGADGTVSKFRETWSAKLAEEGTFVITGTREVEDQPPHTFQWKYFYNAATELIECEMTMSTLEFPVRLEVHLDEAAGAVTLNGQIGVEGTALRIVSRAEGDGGEMKLKGEVTLSGANDVVLLTGAIEHRRPGASPAAKE